MRWQLSKQELESLKSRKHGGIYLFWLSLTDFLFWGGAEFYYSIQLRDRVHLAECVQFFLSAVEHAAFIPLIGFCSQAVSQCVIMLQLTERKIFSQTFLHFIANHGGRHEGNGCTCSVDGNVTNRNLIYIW